MMTMLRRAGLAAACVLMVAGCQGVPTDYKPDPKLKTASVAQLQSGVAAVCVKAERAKSSSSTTELNKPCGCYASKAIKAMDKTEIDFYRANGYFADTARPKAQAARESCGLK